MPFINVKMAKGRTLEQKQEFVAAVTREAVRILHVKPEWVTVVIDEYARDNWATGGELHSLKFGEGYGHINQLKSESAQTNLSPKYTFENFKVCSGNCFSYAASQAVAESPGKAYTPLFIYGATGLGKTHLLHAIGNHVIERNQSVKVMYITAEQFTNEFIESIRENKTKEFRNKYRQADVLLFDDIQFLIGKEQTQEEFFHTFNQLFLESKQIVISSDRLPKELMIFDERLLARFSWGLITEVAASVDNSEKN